MSIDRIMNNLKCELSNRLYEYEQKIEEYLTLSEEYPEHSKYRVMADVYEIKHNEEQGILEEINDTYVW